jgi:hypothetical protein
MKLTDFNSDFTYDKLPEKFTPRFDSGFTGTAIPRPLLHMPLVSNLDLWRGTGQATFSRTTSGTYINRSTGEVSTAQINQLLHSEEFDDVVWTKTAVTITADNAVSPDGSTTMDLVVPTAATSTHFVLQDSSVVSGTTYTQTVYAKSGGYDFLQISGSTGFNATTSWANFDLATGAIGFTGGTGTASIENLGNGIFRCSFVDAATSTTSGRMVITPIDSDRNTRIPGFLGDGVSGVNLWGAQLEEASSAGQYARTGAAVSAGPRFEREFVNSQNLYLHSEEFDDAIWAASNSTITANAAIAPDGTLTADEQIESTATAATFYRFQTATVPDSTTFTISVFAKKAVDNDWIYIRARDKSNTNERVWFNLSTGTIGTSEGSAVGTIEDVGDGWFRCTNTIDSSTGGTLAAGFFGLASGDNVNAYNGDGSSSTYFWGAQLETASSPSPYIKTVAAVRSRHLDIARNLALHSEDFEDAVWSSGGITIDSTNNTDPLGTSTATRIQGTGVSFLVQSITPGDNPATISLFVKSAGAGQDTFRLLVDGGPSSNLTATSEWVRYDFTATPSGAGNYGIARDSADNDFDVLIWGTQVEGNVLEAGPYSSTVAASTQIAQGGVDKGVLIEGASTNLQIRSETFETAAEWTKSRVTVTADDIIAPDGAATADRVVATTDAGTHRIISAGTAVAIETMTASCFVKKGGTSDKVTLRLGDSTEAAFVDLTYTFSSDNVAISTTGAGAKFGTTTGVSRPMGNGWVRIAITSAHLVASETIRPHIRLHDSAGADSFTGVVATDFTYCWGFQVELLPFASSYIPTTTTSVTRAADDLSVDPANIPGPTEDYSVSLKFDAFASTGTNPFLMQVEGETNRRLFLSATPTITFDNGAQDSSAVAFNQVFRFTGTKTSSLQNLFVDGVSVASGAPGSITGTKTAVAIGSDPGAPLRYLQGHIKGFKIFDVALTPKQARQL